MKLICFAHADYVGQDNPILSCKTCCQIFLSALKETQLARDDAKRDQRQWMLDKVNEARRALATEPSHGHHAEK